MKTFDERLGYVLKTTRKAKKLHQPDVAKKLHVTKMTVSYWERGKRGMSAEQLKGYCEVLNVPVQEVFDKMEDE